MMPNFNNMNLQENIKKVLKEETNRKVRIHNMIKDIGIEKTIKMAGGFNRFMKKTDINDPIDYLNLFNGMDKVPSEDLNHTFLYYFNPNNNIIIIIPKLSKVFINQYEIWNVLIREFGLNNSETLDIVTKWLEDEYNTGGYSLAVSNHLNTIK